MFGPLGAAAALLAAAMALDAATLARSPYLQNVGSRHATILWTTFEAGSGKVEYSAGGGDWLEAPASIEEFPASITGLDLAYHQYRADLAGLSPGTEYRYRVLVDGEVLASGEDYALRTPGAGPFRFLAFGDSGAGTPEQRQLAAVMAREQPDLVLHTGDVAYPHGSFRDFDRAVFPVYAEMMRRVCFFLSPGNHEYDAPGAAPYFAMHAFPASGVEGRDHGRYYSFDWGNAHFVALDSNQPLVDAAAGTGRMLEWLEQDLRATRQFWRIAYLHHPPYPSGWRHDDPAGALVRRHVVPILERHGVQLLLAGHEHNYQRTRPMRDAVPVEEGRGTLYVATGGGGAMLYDVGTRPELAFGASAHHYVRGEVADGRLVLQAIGLDGQEIDRVMLLPAPRVSRGAVLNAADFSAGMLAPGGLVSVFGSSLGHDMNPAAALPLPGELCSARLSIAGRRLPLLFASPTQINAQLPWDAAGEFMLRVSTPNGATEIPVAVSETAPAIFSVPADGGMLPALTHSDGRLVSASAPAEPSWWISVWMTGLGRVAGEIQAGEAAPLSPLLPVLAPVHVELGGRQLQPAFAGLAPGQVGLYQVVFRVPPDMPEGMHALTVVAGGRASGEAALAVRPLTRATSAAF